jgi:2-polyprenyl-6-methoxyphenol hydroxylase-like FAD-dependent oxidoreductase
MDVAIFGAGIAGLVTGITMRAHGYRCRVFERLRKTHDAGMGFILVPEGIACLKALGVELTGESSGMRLERYCGRDSSGAILQIQPMPEGARGIRRRDLMAALVKALARRDTTVVEAELSNLEFDERGFVKQARLADGTSVIADLYVGAEGIHSRARQALFPDWPATEARVPEVVGLVHAPETVRWTGHNFNKFHAEDGGIAVGVLPVDAEHVICFLQFDSQRFLQPREDTAACRTFVHKLIGRWAEPIPNLLSKIDFAHVHVWRPIDTELVPHFGQGNLALVGDAAHPLSPFTSQGVSSAVADAVALAEMVSSGRNLKVALAAYSAERRRECAPFIAKGRELMQHFLMPLEVESMLLPIA